MRQALRLHEDERNEALVVFEPPFDWGFLRTHEVLRRWHVFLEDTHRVLLLHSSGAVQELTLDPSGRATRRELLEGAEAEAVLRREGFPVSDAHRVWVQGSLKRGTPLEAALDAKFPRRIGLHRLRTAESTLHRYRFGLDGALEVRVDDEGRVRTTRILTDSDAFDAIAEHDHRTLWDLPDFPMNPIPARTMAEARLYVEVQKGTWRETEEREEGLAVRVFIPEGARCFVFDIADRTLADPLDFGPGRSACLDPTDLVLFASRVERDLPSDPDLLPPGGPARVVRRIRQAAEGLRQVLRWIPDGADLPPEDGLYLTLPGTFFRKKHPERYRRDHLVAEAARLDELAEIWAAFC